VNMKINGIEVPEPMRTAPEKGTWYWYPLPNNLNGVGCDLWNNDAFDTERLRRGICHSTEDAARKHFEALIAPSRADAQPNSVEIDGIKEPKWINWNGGVRPVSPGTDTEIKQRCGHTHRSTHPQDWSWLHSPMNDSMEIIAYRVWPAEPACTTPDSEQELARKVQKLFSDARDERKKEHQQQRFELVKVVLAGLIAHHGSHNGADKFYLKVAIEYADRVLAELERTR